MVLKDRWLGGGRRGVGGREGPGMRSGIRSGGRVWDAGGCWRMGCGTQLVISWACWVAVLVSGERLYIL